MSDITETVVRFRGMNQSVSGVALDVRQGWALSCVNVIPDTASGSLQKLRIPTILSTAIGGTGPNQFFMFSNALTGLKQILALFGEAFYYWTLDDLTAATLLDTNADYNGPTPMSGVVANNQLFLNNGVMAGGLKFTGTLLEQWGIQQCVVPTIGIPFGTGITLATGRMYRASYKNTVTGHVGTASAGSVSTGPVTDKTIPVTIDTPPDADGQIDAVRLYATLDSGSDYFFLAEVSGAFPITFNDDIDDSLLDQSERAPLINDQPPRCRYLAKWGARIFGFNITAESIVNGLVPRPQGIFYTGYNRILVGRPEESIPPSNRLLLETGADEISGGGVITAGVIAFDKSNKMFMFRGQPEDITTNAPVEFTLYLQQLPWDIGCSGHFTIQGTPYGLVWRTPDRQVRLFNGTDKPDIISGGVEPIMKRITYGTELQERSAYWSFNEKDWYLLAIAVDQSTQLNMLLIFDLTPGKDNVGIFSFEIAYIDADSNPVAGTFDSLGVIEMVSGEQKLVIGKDGMLQELTVISKCINGVTQAPTSTAGQLRSNWRSGYFGNQNPQQYKFMQFSRVSVDADGFNVKRYLVDDDVSTMSAPDIIEVEPITEPRFDTALDTRRMSVEIQFPVQDKDCAMQLLTNTYVPGAER